MKENVLITLFRKYIAMISILVSSLVALIIFQQFDDPSAWGYMIPIGVAVGVSLQNSWNNKHKALNASTKKSNPL